MTPPAELLALAAEFPAATRQNWRDLVRDVLIRSGVPNADTVEDPERLLSATTYDGIEIAPLYTAADRAPAAGVPGLPPFTRGGLPVGTVTGWDVRTRHADPDPAAVNAAVLADLENGAGSVWLVLGPAGLPVGGLDAALSGVLLDLAPVTLDAGADVSTAADALLALHADRGVPDGEVRGNLGADPLGLAARTGTEPDLAGAAALVTRHAGRYPRLRGMVVDGLPYHQAGGSDAEELGCAIATGVAYLRALTAAGLDATAAARQLEFRLAVGVDQFLGIAKLRAARRLWARVTEVCGSAERAQRQHAVTAPAMMTRRDPWVNLLRTTVAGFAAGVGGADAVTVAPFDAAIGRSNDFARRIARNTQAILVEESRLAGVIDPAGGSWYVESLTDALARAAWAVFTDLERTGGIAAALASGELAGRLADTWARRSAKIATRADAITGVSEYPNVAEVAVERPPPPGEPGRGGLPVVRYAEAFEELRDWADAELVDGGRRPAVFLATLGPVAAHAARAGFAANLLGAGGFDPINAGATDGPDAVVAAFADSGAAIACLCGTDAAYAEQAARLAGELKRAGAAAVLLAGSPNDDFPDVDVFLYRGCDALAVLRTTRDRWESARREVSA